jgi:hypothetical protein
VGRRSGPAGRAVARLARLAGTHACQHDSRASAFSQIQACGQARGIPVTVFTALEVRTRPAASGPVPLAITPGGQVTAVTRTQKVRAPWGDLRCFRSSAA